MVDEHGVQENNNEIHNEEHNHNLQTRRVQIVDEFGNYSTVQYPVPTDGDSVYYKDICPDCSDIGDFSGEVFDLFNDLHTIIENTTNKILISDKNDNLIIGTALSKKNRNMGKDVTLVSKDANVRIKAKAIGLNAENFESDKVNFDELYTGFTEVDIDAEKFSQLEQKDFLKNNLGDLKPNQFVIFKNAENEIITRYSQSNNSLYKLKYYHGQRVFGIEAKNREQVLSFDLLLDPNVQFVSLMGIAGTGKTLLALAAGLNQVMEKDNYKRLIVSRPIFPLGKDLGFLPGTKSEKFNPWMQPIYDNMEIILSKKSNTADKKSGKIFGTKHPHIQEYLDYGFLELEPLTYIRGRSLPEQFIIIDEAQNLTPHEMKTIITRAGEHTKIVITGDPYQIDIPYLDSESNGLSVAVDKLQNENIVGHVTLNKGERSLLAELAAKFF